MHSRASLHLKKNLAVLSIILFLTFLAYSNIFDNQFILDDHNFILNWPQLKTPLANLPAFLKGQLPFDEGGVYRPFRSIVYAASYQLFGVNPFGYHLQSLTTHLLIVANTYLLTYLLSKSNITSFTNSLLFALHPHHTEAITWISASFDTLGILFFFTAFNLYLLKPHFTQYSNFLHWISLLFSLLAVFTYEITLTLPIIITAHNFLFSKSSSLMTSLKLTKSHYTPLALYLFIRLGILNIPLFSTNSVFTSINDRLVISTIAFSKHLINTLIPLTSSFNQKITPLITNLSFLEVSSIDHNLIPLSSSPIFISSLLALLTIIYFAHKQSRSHPLITFSLIWFTITIFPILPFNSRSSLLAQRYTYLASFSLTLLISLSLSHFAKHKTPLIKHSSTVLFFLISTFFFTQTYQRNQDWHDPLTFWNKTLSQTPNSTFALSHKALAYSNSGNFEAAIPLIHKAIDINPNDVINLTNLATLYYRQDNFELAIQNLSSALQVDSNYAPAHLKLADIYSQQQNYPQAINHYRIALKLNPSSIPTYINLSTAYLATGENKLALNTLNQLLLLDPNNPNTHQALGQYYQHTNQLDQAIKYYQQALSLDPNFTPAQTALKTLSAN